MEDGSVVPLLVQNRTGYQNLCRLISTAKLEPRPADLAPVTPGRVSQLRDSLQASWRAFHGLT